MTAGALCGTRKTPEIALGGGNLLVGVVGLQLIFGEFLLVDGPPSIDDVDQDKGDDHRHVEHGA